MRLRRSERRLLMAGLVVLALLVIMPLAAVAWLCWEGDELIPYPDGPPTAP